MRSLTVWTAVTGLSIMGFFAIRSIAVTVHNFLDPCFFWGSANITSGPCTSHVGGTPQTKAQALILLALVAGGLLSAAVLGMRGAFRREPRPTLFAAALMFAEVPLMFSLWPVALVTAGVLLRLGLVDRKLPALSNS